MSFPKPDITSFPALASGNEYLFSILIPSWNNLEMLQFCVESILANSDFKHQIIIHVNEGIDGTLEWVKSQGYGYTHSTENAGVCYSVNAMTRLAKTPYLLYLNDDMYVCKNWDSEIYREVKAQKDDLWYISGTMIEPVTSGNQCVIAPFDFGRSPSEFRKSELDRFAADYKMKNWFGSCWPPSLVSKSLFEKVGGYSEEFSPGMYSDPDFGMKLWAAGVRHFVGLGGCKVYHFQSKSTGRVKKNDGRRQFAAKWGFTASYFYKQVLRMGKTYHSEIKLHFPKGIFFLFNRLKSMWLSK